MNRITIITLLLLIIIGAGGYFLLQKRHNYFFQREELYEVEEEGVDIEEIFESDEEAERILKQQEDFKEEQSEEEEVKEEAGGELDETEINYEENEYESPVVELVDCENECEDFTDENEFAYCEEVCGFAEDDLNRTSEDCEELEIFARDACYKQQAVNEEDMSICKKIYDGTLKENCENRVLEEILDN